MTLYGLQLDIAWEDKPANFARVTEWLRRSPPAAGSLVVLPEMFATGFSMDVARIAEEPGGPTDQCLATLAREHQVTVLGGVVTRAPDGRGRNQAVAFDPAGRELARYTKLQPYSVGGETRHYEPGSSVAFFPWQTVLVSPFVCYDLRFPEHFRTAARRQPAVLAVIANWLPYRIHHWVRLLQARAIENQAWVIGVNRCGPDPEHRYPGRSVIVDPHGEVVADAGDQEGVIRAEFDPADLERYRREFPVLADLR